MIFSCTYDETGKIHKWTSCNRFNVNAGNMGVHTDKKGTLLYPNRKNGVVAKFPKEVLALGDLWAKDNLRVAQVYPNGSVEVVRA